VSPMPFRMCVAADTVAVRCAHDGRLQVLLVVRGNEPFEGRWALPGGFVEEHEDLPDAAARELAEETGLRPVVMDQVGAWGTPGRDPRGRVVSIVYVAVARPGADTVRGADDAARAAWRPVENLPPLAFDHDQILPAALEHLRRRCETTCMAFAFLEESFTMDELSRALAALGAAQPRSAAARLVAEAGLAAGVGPECRFSLARMAYLAPLRTPVWVFPATHEGGE